MKNRAYGSWTMDLPSVLRIFYNIYSISKREVYCSLYDGTLSPIVEGIQACHNSLGLKYIFLKCFDAVNISTVLIDDGIHFD